MASVLPSPAAGDAIEANSALLSLWISPQAGNGASRRWEQEVPSKTRSSPRWVCLPILEIPPFPRTPGPNDAAGGGSSVRGLLRFFLERPSRTSHLGAYYQGFRSVYHGRCACTSGLYEVSSSVHRFWASTGCPGKPPPPHVSSLPSRPSPHTQYQLKPPQPPVRAGP